MRIVILIFLITTFIFTSPVAAASDPRLKPNNKVGIGILSPEAEIEEAASMVNTGGDWGWVVIIIKKSERNLDRWQKVFHLLSKNHLIPIVRIATDFDKQGYWMRPTDEDSKDWADFLSKLYWPTKNRYIQIYNEVNRANEWGGEVDPANFAKEFEKTRDALKAINEDFFVLNAPLDLAAETGDESLNSFVFYQTMEATVPGIFRKLDGWASHSYPNPSFSASPLRSGRNGIDGYKWELSQIAQYLEGKNLPVFITETGWQRKIAGGVGVDENLIANYYKIAFGQVWNDEEIAAVAPFIFNYPEPLYYSFSFKTNTKNSEQKYFNYYFSVKDLTKINGDPEREDKVSDFQIDLPEMIIKGRLKDVNLTMKNVGNYIWNTKDKLKLKIFSQNLEVMEIKWNKDEIYPGEKAIVTFKLKSNKEGPTPINIKVFDDNFNLIEKELVVSSETYFSFIVRSMKRLF